MEKDRKISGEPPETINLEKISLFLLIKLVIFDFADH